LERELGKLRVFEVESIIGMHHELVCRILTEGMIPNVLVYIV
jgi:hypothetical protein